jgi:hypothetical protein
MQSSDFSLNDVQLLERFLKNNLTQENFEISLALTCESLANGWENIVVDDHKLDQINEFACKQMSIQPVEIENSKSFPAAYLSELGVKLADHKFSKTESDLGAAYQKMVNDALCISQPYTFALTVEHLNKDKINFYAAWMQTPWLNALTRSDPDADYVDFIRDVENQLWQERKFFNQFMIAKIKECSQADPNYTFEAKLDLENDRFGVCSYILNDQAQGWVDQQAKTWLKDFLQMRAKNKIGLSEFQKIILKQSSRPD